MLQSKYVPNFIAVILTCLCWTTTASLLKGQEGSTSSFAVDTWQDNESSADSSMEVLDVEVNPQDFLLLPAVQPTRELSLFAGIDGSKQPQDYGVNANLGGRFHFNYSAALAPESSIGFQVGAALNETSNAVRVYELLGEDTSRQQLFVTAGLFRRSEIFGGGIVVDLLNQDSYDEATLGQIRSRFSCQLNARNEVGITTRFRLFDDETRFLGNPVTLTPIDQGSLFLRHLFDSGVQGTVWLGIADAISESNAVTGYSPPKDECLVFGADFLAPLNDRLALYGETNLTFPADTGTVDAFLGIAWYPFGNARCARRHQYSEMLPVAAPTSFGVNSIPH